MRDIGKLRIKNSLGETEGEDFGDNRGLWGNGSLQRGRPIGRMIKYYFREREGKSVWN